MPCNILQLFIYFFLLQKELEAKESQLVVSQFLQELISGIRTPERARSPVDAYITEEEIFHRNNPGVELLLIFVAIQVLN